MFKFKQFYPNEFSEKEQEALDTYRAGKIQPMVPGYENGKPIDMVDMVLYARCWNRYNPLFNDVDYARNTRFGDLPAVPCFARPEGRAALPQELGYHNMIPMASPLIGDGYDHEIHYYKPIFAGDSFSVRYTLYDYKDLTPPGSEFRFMIMINAAEMYNQRGELVASCLQHWPELFVQPEDPAIDSDKLRAQLPHGSRYIHPIHEYTAEDWEFIKELWRGEKIRGSETLYWEDVNIGDEPTPTCEGAVTQAEILRTHGYEFAGRTGYREVLLSGAKLTQGEHGLYTVGIINAFLTDRAQMLNYTGRGHAVRMVTNWCGDNGFVSKVAWRMINDVPPEQQKNRFPEDHFRPSYLLKVPYLKEKGRFMNTHGFTPDCSIVRGYVTDKYTKNNEFFVDLTVWCEDLDNNIFQECEFTVKLPSRSQRS